MRGRAVQFRFDSLYAVALSGVCSILHIALCRASRPAKVYEEWNQGKTLLRGAPMWNWGSRVVPTISASVSRKIFGNDPLGLIFLAVAGQHPGSCLRLRDIGVECSQATFVQLV